MPVVPWFALRDFYNASLLCEGSIPSNAPTAMAVVQVKG